MAKNKKIGIIDYSIGNLYSVAKAFDYLGASPVLMSDPKELSSVDRLVLPGVGAFDRCYNELKSRGFIEPILEFINSQKLFLGICVGMQLLFSKSYEGTISKGLDIINGVVKRMPSTVEDKIYKIPHVGWKEIISYPQTSLLMSSDYNYDRFYFVHSFNAHVSDEQVKVAYADYSGLKITAFVEKENVFGCQFHPEKSRDSGLKLLNNFIKL